MIELPSAFAESGAYPPDRALSGSPRQCSLSLACRHTSRSTWEHHPQPTIPPLHLNRHAESRWLHLSRVSPALHPPERPSHIHTPKPGLPLSLRQKRRFAPVTSLRRSLKALYHLQPSVRTRERDNARLKKLGTKSTHYKMSSQTFCPSLLQAE